MIKIIFIIFVVIVLIFGLVVFRGAPYVPSKRRDLKKAFSKVYPMGESDVLVDIGSGDGVVLRQAARHGARAIGYELNIILVAISMLLNRRYGPRISVIFADFWFVKLPRETTIVYTFGESRDIKKMYHKVEKEARRLQKPLYFMSYGFSVPGQEAVKEDGAIHLYLIQPLQAS